MIMMQFKDKDQAYKLMKQIKNIKREVKELEECFDETVRDMEDEYGEGRDDNEYENNRYSYKRYRY